MPTMLLTDISVRALKGSEKHEKFFDTKTPGFGIRVGKKAKTWVCMRGKTRELITIGRYPDMSLSEARIEAKKLLANEPEPKVTKITWGKASEEFLETHYQGNTSRWPHLVKLTFGKHFAHLGDKQLSEIEDTDIQRILQKLKATPSTQLHAYRVARTFLTWCTRPPRRYIKHSPMEGYTPPGKDRKGTRILSDDELKAIWNVTGEGSRRVFRLMILWGTRSAETCALERNWAVDDVLTIPGSATKNGRDHAIPLLPEAKAILGALPNTGPYYFRGRHYASKSMTASALGKMRYEIQKESGTTGWHARDIRRTFRSNMARLKVPRDLCEVLINHAPPVLDEIYDRYDRLKEKRSALLKHEKFVIGLLAEESS